MWRKSLIVLSLLVAACASNASKDDHMVNGHLGRGGAMSGQRDGGVAWALRVEGEDVVLEVDGATARFVGGAAHGGVEFEHSLDGSSWNLDLDGGEVTSRSGEVTVNGRAHAFHSGTSLVFGPTGRLLRQPLTESAPR